MLDSYSCIRGPIRGRSSLILESCSVKIVIHSLLRDQFRMRALLDGQAVMDGHDPVGMRVTLIPSRRVQGDRLL
jgi:hypothetical protein